MRLFLLPVSTRRSLLYCEKTPAAPPERRSYYDTLTRKATETWAAWEKDTAAVGNWKHKVTFYGNQALSRIPFEEWGLKTIPALTPQRKQAIRDGNARYDVLFPGRYLPVARVAGILEKLAQDRQALHRRRLIWSVVIMPFTAPFMLVPIVPNLPFFYVLYRAWSHWKALAGARHLAFLLQHGLPKPHPSWPLDEVYTAGLMYPTRALSRAAPRPTQKHADDVAAVVHKQTNNETQDVMLLQRWNGKLIAEQFDLPDMEVEVERAVEQVEKSIKDQERLAEEKLEQERAVGKDNKRAVEKLPEHILERIHDGVEDIAQGIKEKARR